MNDKFLKIFIINHQRGEDCHFNLNGISFSGCHWNQEMTTNMMRRTKLSSGRLHTRWWRASTVKAISNDGGNSNRGFLNQQKQPRTMTARTIGAKEEFAFEKSNKRHKKMWRRNINYDEDFWRTAFTTEDNGRWSDTRHEQNQVRTRWCQRDRQKEDKRTDSNGTPRQ